MSIPLFVAPVGLSVLVAVAGVDALSVLLAEGTPPSLVPATSVLNVAVNGVEVASVQAEVPIGGCGACFTAPPMLASSNVYPGGWPLSNTSTRVTLSAGPGTDALVTYHVARLDLKACTLPTLHWVQFAQVASPYSLDIQGGGYRSVGMVYVCLISGGPSGPVTVKGTPAGGFATLSCTTSDVVPTQTPPPTLPSLGLATVVGFPAAAVELLSLSTLLSQDLDTVGIRSTCGAVVCRGGTCGNTSHTVLSGVRVNPSLSTLAGLPGTTITLSFEGALVAPGDCVALLADPLMSSCTTSDACVPVPPGGTLTMRAPTDAPLPPILRVCYSLCSGFGSSVLSTTVRVMDLTAVSFSPGTVHSSSIAPGGQLSLTVNGTGLEAGDTFTLIGQPSSGAPDCTAPTPQSIWRCNISMAEGQLYLEAVCKAPASQTAAGSWVVCLQVPSQMGRAAMQLRPAARVALPAVVVPRPVPSPTPPIVISKTSIILYACGGVLVSVLVVWGTIVCCKRRGYCGGPGPEGLGCTCPGCPCGRSKPVQPNKYLHKTHPQPQPQPGGYVDGGAHGGEDRRVPVPHPQSSPLRNGASRRWP